MDRAWTHSGDRSWWWSDTALLVWLALLNMLIHVLTSGNYGYFRDEFYYIACSKRLAWGYVDHPPLSIALLALTRGLLGDSLFAIRLPAALAGGLTVFLTGMLARELGGGRFAQCIAALACLLMPLALGLTTVFSMNAFEPLLWLGGTLIVVRVVNTGDRRLWLAFGIVAGLGLLNKISMGMFVLGIVAGLLFTPRRGDLWSGWLWLGGAAAALLFLPHVLWQVANGFPTIEFIRVATERKIAPMSFGQFLGAQLLYAGPLAAPIWLAGLAFFLFAAGGRPYRMVGMAYVVMLALLMAQHGKAYYLAPAYPILFAGGGVALGQVSARRRWWWWLRPALTMLVVIDGALAAPMAIPLLPPDMIVRYMAGAGIDTPQEERHERVELPQHFADRFGWENMVATIARVYQSLPPGDRARVTIFASNYGEAGAIDFFGPRYGLPKAVSGHNDYWLWGPGNATGEVVIAVGASRDELAEIFDEVTQADTIVSPYAMAYETNLPVYVCRRLKRPLAEVWLALKRYI
jgi:hypothetical protein